jgi:hypothetical protein
MHETVQVRIVHFLRHVVDEQDSAALACKIVFERKNLATITEGVAGKQPDIRQTVEHRTIRLHLLDTVHHQPDRFAQLKIR